MFIRKKEYLKLRKEFAHMSETVEREKDNAMRYMRANGELKREIHRLEKENEELRIANEKLADPLMPKPCDGCIHSDNYRKCASCARYPKIKDKYEMEDM